MNIIKSLTDIKFIANEQQREFEYSDELSLEWSNESAGSLQSHISYNKNQPVLEIETPSNLKWLRLVVPLNKFSKADAVAIEIKLSVNGDRDGSKYVINPIIAVRRDSKNKYRFGINETNKDLLLDKGKIATVFGLFSFPEKSDFKEYDLLIILPRSSLISLYNISIADISYTNKNYNETIVPLVEFHQIRESHKEENFLSDFSKNVFSLPRDVDDFTASVIFLQNIDCKNEIIKSVFRIMGCDIRIISCEKDDRKVNLLLDRILCEHVCRKSFNKEIKEDFAAIANFSQKKGGISLSNAKKVYLMNDQRKDKLENIFPKNMIDHKLTSGFIDNGSIHDEGSVYIDINKEFFLSKVGVAFLSSIDGLVHGLNITAAQNSLADFKYIDMALGVPYTEENTISVGTATSIISKSSDRTSLPSICLGHSCNYSEDTFEYILDHLSIEEIDLAYAVILTDDISKAKGLINIENCVVLSELEVLATITSPYNFNKPIIILNNNMKYHREHIIKSVSKHWMYAGKYTITDCICNYDARNNEFDFSFCDHDQLCSSTYYKSIQTIPLGIFLRYAYNSNILYFEDQPLIYSRSYNSNASYITYLEHSYSMETFGESEVENISKKSAISYEECLEVRNNLNNWPIFELTKSVISTHKHVDNCINKFIDDNDIDTAIEVLRLIKSIEKDLYLHYKLIDEFFIEISLTPGVLLQLEFDELIILFENIRKTYSSNLIAENIIIILDRVALKEVRTLIPIMDFVAVCVNQENVDLFLVSLISNINDINSRFTMWTSDCVGRYGSSLTQAKIVLKLDSIDRDGFTNSNIVSKFHLLLNGDLTLIINNILGYDVSKLIYKKLDSITKIKYAINSKDSVQVNKLLYDPIIMSSVKPKKLLDQLRGFSNELRNFNIDVSSIGNDDFLTLPNKRLASIIFSDKLSIKSMLHDEALEFEEEINAIAKHIINENYAINEHIAQKFSNLGVSPIKIKGDTASEVFKNAASNSIKSPIKTYEKKVSVIMSAFNVDVELMRYAVESLLNQTYSNLEIIIVDDFSSDEKSQETKALCEGYNNTLYIKTSGNYGPYVGRNIALGISSGEFIAINDADDWSHPEKLELQIAMFSNNSSARLVTTKHIRIDKAGKVQLEADFSLSGDGPMTSVFRRSVFDEIGVFAEVRSRGDVEMRERIRSYYGSHAIEIIEAPLMLCYADSGTLSQSVNQKLAEHLQLWRHNISKRDSLNYYRESKLSILDCQKIAVPNALRPSKGMNQ